MGSINKRPLNAYVRYDGSGRVVAGSLVLRRKIPKVGNWKQLPQDIAYEWIRGQEGTHMRNEKSVASCSQHC